MIQPVFKAFWLEGKLGVPHLQYKSKLAISSAMLSLCQGKKAQERRGKEQTKITMQQGHTTMTVVYCGIYK